MNWRERGDDEDRRSEARERMRDWDEDKRMNRHPGGQPRLLAGSIPAAGPDAWDKSVKHEVSKLEGALLDAAVAKALGGKMVVLESSRYGDCGEEVSAIYEGRPTPSTENEHWNPSEDWSQGGVIIEREQISLIEAGDAAGGWFALVRGVNDDIHGRTHLLAAMRAFVVLKLGDEIELP